MLDKIDYCAITTDCWTSSANLGYLTVTCRFITIDFILRSTVLSTKPLLKQTNHISTSVIHVFQEWSITDEVVAIVIDNASSMLKACEIMQKRNLPCLAHTLNLVMQDSLALEEVKEVVTKCKRIVTFFKSSSIAYAKFRDAQDVCNPVNLKQEVTTRWNSAFFMIERILATNEAITKVLLITPAPPALTADDIMFLTDLMKLMGPFNQATLQTSANSSVKISTIVLLLCGRLYNLNSEGKKACDC